MSWIYINKFVFGEDEKQMVDDCIKGNWFAGNSKFNTEFEKEVCKHANVKFFQTTNSGSAAIEIAIQVLKQTGKIKTGDKFIHPAITFPTSLSSAIMAGMIPVYVDSDEGTYQVSVEEVEKALQQHPDIAFAIIPALLGNIPDVGRLRELLGNRPIIFDSCDVMGGKYDGQEFVGFGDFGAYSFYGSHHISSFGVGGGLATNNEEYAKLAKSLTFWGRDFSTDNLEPLQSFLKRYSYETLGLDAQMTAVQAAVGLAQIRKLPYFVGERNRIFRKLQIHFSSKINSYVLPTRTTDRTDPSWFCYPLVVRENAKFTRDDFAYYMLENQVEVRPIMAGNILNHKPFSNSPYYTIGDLKEANRVYNRGLFIPCYAMDEETENKYFDILKGWLDRV